VEREHSHGTAKHCGGETEGLSSGKVEEHHCRIRATEGEVYIRSGRKELGLEGASGCYI
jgi:hypothetical protein